MRHFGTEARGIMDRADALLADPSASAARAMPGSALFMDDGDVLALPRDDGDSRYPYGADGFNFWAHASGYMYANEGLFSWFLRSAEGQEPRIAFFAAMPESTGYRPVPLLPVPALPGVEANGRRYTVFTMSAAYYVAELAGARFVLRVFVTRRKGLCFSLHMDNPGKTDARFLLSGFMNPYFRHQIYESSEDRWFKEMRVSGADRADGCLASFLVLVNEDKDRHHSITNSAVIRRRFTPGRGARVVRSEATTSRNQYVGGVRSSLHAPAALRVGTFGEPQDVCTFVENAIAGDLLEVILPAGGEAQMDWVLERTESVEVATKLAGEAVDTAALDAELECVSESVAAGLKGLSATVRGSVDPALRPDVFNCFLEHLKKQIEFCSLIKGYVQLSENSLIGIRDVFQALEAYAFWQPAAAKAKMLEALGFTSPDGRCFRQYSLPGAGGECGRMDLRPFIDQGSWVISCVSTYLKLTGDWAFLAERCGYHEIVDESARVVTRSRLSDSVLEHLVRVMDYLLANRDPETGCVRALYGDWNDALDGLGLSREPGRAYGSGVSVMAALHVFQNCREMAAILERADAARHAVRINAYKQAAEHMADNLRRYAVVSGPGGQKRIVHGWGDARSYLVGSFGDPDGVARDGLTSNAFWVLSGMHDDDPAMRDVILSAFRRLDSKYGLKTFEPFFPPDTPGVGRIGKLPPGTAENGAAYVHATVFAIMALFRMGCAREAWEQLVKVLPFTDLHQNLSHSPFVMPNSYGLNPGKRIDGQNMNDWQTGSSNVLLKALARFVFGLEPEFDGVWIQPANWIPFESFEFEGRWQGRAIRIRYANRKSGKRRFLVNGAERQGERHALLGVDRLWLAAGEIGADGVTVDVVE